MKTVIEMAREVCGVHTEWTGAPLERLTHFAALVRADERNRLADKLQQDFKGAFGADTCASWAVWLRSQR